MRATKELTTARTAKSVRLVGPVNDGQGRRRHHELFPALVTQDYATFFPRHFHTILPRWAFCRSLLLLPGQSVQLSFFYLTHVASWQCAVHDHKDPEATTDACYLKRRDLPGPAWAL